LVAIARRRAGGKTGAQAGGQADAQAGAQAGAQSERLPSLPPLSRSRSAEP
jgi:hypothetical protein